MAEYERSRTIRVPEDDVFAFVAAPGNLATFVPTVTAVEPQADGRVRIRGEHGGRSYEDEGWFHADPDRRHLEWGAEEREYSGWLTVSGSDDGSSQVVVHLSVPPFVTASGRPVTGEVAAERDPIDGGLEAALDSLRNILEGRGGKKEA
jgi:uncharacterized protein YndB with AHSA1/START domain